MGFVKAASKSDLAEGRMIPLEAEGKEIVIANVNGNYYAIGNRCTHMRCMLSDGILKGEQLQCPCHGSIFNVKNGSVVKGPATKPESIFQVKEEKDQILVKL
jgi:nitrite reductase/ring-hydroxylating ferredoxin subunit